MSQRVHWLCPSPCCRCGSEYCRQRVCYGRDLSRDRRSDAACDIHDVHQSLSPLLFKYLYAAFGKILLDCYVAGPAQYPDYYPKHVIEFHLLPARGQAPNDDTHISGSLKFEFWSHLKKHFLYPIQLFNCHRSSASSVILRLSKTVR